MRSLVKIILFLGLFAAIGWHPSWAENNILIITPQDKEIVYEDSIMVIGILSNPNVDSVLVNDEPAKLVNQRFRAKVPLTTGKNLITVTTVEGDNGPVLNSRRILKKESYPDIKNYFWAKRSIEDLSTLGFMSRYYDGTFKPEKQVERSELAATLVKIDETPLPDVTEDLFVDVSKTYWGAPYIQVAIDKGYFTDYPDGSFKPTRFVSKAEAVVILLRYAGIREPKSIKEAPFSDVPANHWAAKAITKAKELGIIKDTLYFKPNEDLTRATLAFIIAKIPDIESQINDLTNWDSYNNLKKKAKTLKPSQQYSQKSDPFG